MAAMACVGVSAELSAARAVLAAQSNRTAEPATAVQRAGAILATTQQWLAKDDGSGLYHEHFPTSSPDGVAADEWPFSQVHIGVLDLTGIRGAAGERYRGALAAHRAAQQLYWIDRSANGLPAFASRVGAPRGRGGDVYYDDNLWVGLAAMQHWRFHRDTESLALARTIFALVRPAWDTDPRHPAPGGLFWTQAPGNLDRNTVSNMPAAQLGVRLFEATGDATYLRDALRYHDWTKRTLQRSDGLYLDHIKVDGAIDTRVFTYNQGAPIGVNVLLHTATGEARYLAEARRIADASFAHFVASRRIDRESMPFNAIFFKNLLLLESVIGGARHRTAMRDYAERMWRDHRDAKTGLFIRPNRPHRGRIELIDQGAMLQIFAVLAWDPADHGHLY